MDLQVKGIYWPNVASSSFARRFISSTIRHRYVGMPPALPVSVMAMAAQAIANDGEMLKPYLIQRITTPNGDTKQEGETEVLSEVTSKETADRVTSAMTLAAVRYGFGYIGPEGWDVAAKTGTAETGKSYNGWIVSFAPSEDPKYVVVVMAADQDHDGIYYKYAVDQIYDALVDYDQLRDSSSSSDE